MIWIMSSLAALAREISSLAGETYSAQEVIAYARSVVARASLVDVLQLALQAERTAPDLTRLPPEMILAAMTRLDELRDAIHPTPTSELFEQYDSLTDHLGTIAMMRAKKIRDAVGYGATDEHAAAGDRVLRRGRRGHNRARASVGDRVV